MKRKVREQNNEESLEATGTFILSFELASLLEKVGLGWNLLEVS